MSADEPSEDPMTYQILGGDESTTKEKLEKYTGEVDWAYLAPHYHNGALLYIDPALSLAEVGEALTRDDAERIQAWKQNGDIVAPSGPHAAYWEESGETFRALVVSPFVLIQPALESSSTG